MRGVVGYQPGTEDSPPRIAVGIDAGQTAGGVGLLLAGAALALVAIPLYKRAVTSVYERRAAQIESAMAANRAAYAELAKAHKHVKAKGARYRRKG